MPTIDAVPYLQFAPSYSNARLCIQATIDSLESTTADF